MNNFVVDLLPVLLFFIVFKYQDIYAATWVGIITTFIQVSISRFWYKRWDKVQLLTLAIFLLFGGMTLYFRNPIFIKWKPTIIFWIFAVILFLSHFIGAKPMVHRILEGALKTKSIAEPIAISSGLGKRLNIAWMVFFAVLGMVNLYVAYHFDDNVWVNFKLYGVTGATLVFSLLQTLLLGRRIKVGEK